MEDILFRGKCVENKPFRIKEGEWVEGLPMYTSIKSQKGEIDRILALKDGYYQLFLIRPETICQYTGCLTSDIKKIFTNDIVGVDGIIGVVKFGKYGNGFHLGYYIQWINSEFRQELGFWEGKVKHLGNVFDNPELIKR